MLYKYYTSYAIPITNFVHEISFDCNDDTEESKVNPYISTFLFYETCWRMKFCSFIWFPVEWDIWRIYFVSVLHCNSIRETESGSCSESVTMHCITASLLELYLENVTFLMNCGLCKLIWIFILLDWVKRDEPSHFLDSSIMYLFLKSCSISQHKPICNTHFMLTVRMVP